MVVLTIVAQNNEETVYFEEPIPKVHSIRLLSCSLYNSWHNLQNEGSAKQVSKILPGHYTLESLAKEIGGLFAKCDYKLETETNQPVGQLVIKHFGLKPITFDRDLSRLLGIGRNLKLITFVKRLTSPTTYFIHCDLLDKTKTFLNGKRSDVLARFDIKSLPYVKVSYDSTLQQVLRDCSINVYVNSITVSVKDERGELFDFKGMPLKFELEIN